MNRVGWPTIETDSGPQQVNESRIPRPSSGSSPTSPLTARRSPLALRRGNSMRSRADSLTDHNRQQLQYHQASLHQHHQRRNRHTDNVFPVITENGTDSPRQRSLSLSLTPARPRRGLSAVAVASACEDSDVESVKSYGSGCSAISACDHATFALNGTTWSGRSRKYVVHCSNHNDEGEQYLTPTQRAARQIRKFQTLLKEARKDIEDKDREILRLTKEVVELRLYKASLNSPEERTDSSDALTVRENNPFSPESPSKDLPDEATAPKVTTPEKRPANQIEPASSLADSGHFEDGSVHSKDSATRIPDASSSVPDVNSTIVPEEDVVEEKFERPSSSNLERDEERRRLVDHYESRIEEMHRRHVDEIQEIKQRHNDKVESLLNQLSEVNTRYCEVRPAVDAAETRARELENELEAVRFELNEQRVLFTEQEEMNQKTYLKMYAKGQEAARIEQANQILEQAQQTPPKASVAELLQQLTVTQAELENVKDTSYSPEPHISTECSQSLLSAQEAVSLWVLGTRKVMYRRIIEAKSSQGTLDPEITLQFLKSAIYYFLTDKENHNNHLNAIESILGFTDSEKLNIDRIYRSARK